MSRHGTALDTLRWGDNIPVTLTGLTGFAGLTQATSQKQIAKAQWRWPLLWGLRIIVSVQSADPAAPDFTIQFQVTIGSGQNSSTATFTYTTANTGIGVYPIITDFIELPAQDVQVTAMVTSTKALGADVTSTVYVGAYLAPTTEPHAMTELLDLAKGEPEGARWMTEHHGPTPSQPGTGQGFPIEPDPLYYQRR